MSRSSRPRAGHLSRSAAVDFHHPYFHRPGAIALKRDPLAVGKPRRRLIQIRAVAIKHFPTATVLPKKTYVSILEKREFAAINIRPKELRLGFDLGERKFDEQVSKSKLTGPMPRISHMVVVTNGDQLKPDLVELLQISYKRSH